MNIVLWILQVVLAVLFLLHGWVYVIQPPAVMEQMRQRNPTPQPDAPDISPGFRRFIGIAEWLAAVGLIASGLTGILPWLTPLAAFGLMIVMAGAVIYHLRRGETQMIIPTGILFLLVTFVAYMRWQVLPL
jgi:uncharacterized membrane protein YphA (DoxX/SURF4 family)